MTILDPWPFAIVPDRERARNWAGRPRQRSELEALVRRWRRRQASELDVLWADFGQGKTHSLLFVQNEVASSSPAAMAHYLQLPPLTAGSPFVALYRQVMRDFPLEDLGRRVFNYFQTNPMHLFQHGTPTERFIYQLLWLIATRSPGSDSAARWLQGDPVSAAVSRSFSIGGRSIGLPAPPNSPQNCQNMLDTLLSICTEFPPGESNQFVLLIDEFQRIGELTPRRRTEVCDSIHLIFNRHPKNLRLVLAFAGGLPQIVTSVLTPDLHSRVTSVFGFPPLSADEGRLYVAELLADYRGGSEVESNNQFFPFEGAAVDLLIRVADEHGENLSPRRINILFDLVADAVLDARAAGDGGLVTLSEAQDGVQRRRAEIARALAEEEN